ncbi:MAG: DUF58 domain-containing protein [Planctomycetota bacterium]|nr:MAG: DUF58 domain-containing protein [Planctomycetota bacterium]REJ90422.1 MAG: DUF58 domain-containing protein [Planctomycetota bacterium]REK30124.1 MAG: DUF58 domain-containing protein [Planctomycetota bacterium]REK37768.1 MAG: DUF58 domain-containing protein [Planctomycetota bacterium]
MSPEAVARVSRLELQARQVVEGFLSGQHRSPYFGQSIEFVQHREYVPGDDVRRIDWKVWSKTDKYYIKQYEEETNLRTTLLVDISESMQFGSGKTTKYDFACSIAAALTYLLLRQQDAVSLLAFDDEVRSRVPSRSRQTHLGAILSVLMQESPSEKTDMYSILRYTADEKSERGMVVLISDLFAPRDGLFRGLNLLRRRGHDVLVFHLMDDEELDFNYSGTTRFEGLEETGELVCDPRALREGYLAAVNEFLDDLRRRCAGSVIDYQTIRTSEHIDAILRHYINHRVGLSHSRRN